MFARDSVMICNGALTNFSSAQALLDTIPPALVSDFTGPLSPLPSVLYPCVPRKKVWAPLWTIVWECYTTAAATLSPAFVVITFILLWTCGIDPNEPKSHNGHEAIPLRQNQNQPPVLDSPARDSYKSPISAASASPSQGYFVAAPHLDYDRSYYDPYSEASKRQGYTAVSR
jgi:hypothetical protein